MKFLQVHKRSLFPSKAILDRKITLNPERLPKLKLKFDAQFKSYRPNPKKSYFQGSSFQNFWFPIPPDPPPLIVFEPSPQLQISLHRLYFNNYLFNHYFVVKSS